MEVKNDLTSEINDKKILHWNFRGFNELPIELNYCGSEIEELYLKENKITVIPNWIDRLTHLTNLYLSGNKLRELPDEFERMEQLKVLDLSGNDLELFPSSIKGLRSLRELILDDNSMSSLPFELQQFNELESLSLCGNNFSTLPEWLGSLSNLQRLLIDNNCLEELPNRLTLSPSLEIISVCSNRLKYLPLNSFISPTIIYFNCNRNLNYLSYPVFCQLLELGWDDGKNCFSNNLDIDETKSQKRIRLTVDLDLDNGDNKAIIELPRQLIRAFNVEDKEPSSLWELSLRNLYKNKAKTKKKQHSDPYSKDTLEEALAAIRNGLSVIQASRDYGIPKSTLRYKKRSPRSQRIPQRGPHSILGQDNERSLVRWIRRRVDNKLPITKNQLLESVRIFLNRMGRKTVFQNNRPGKHWYEAFEKRHNLSGEITPAQIIGETNDVKLVKWFTQVRSYLSERNLLDIDASRVFNCFEMAIMLNPIDKNTLIRPADNKSYRYFKNGDPKECVSTMMCGNADGQLSPPLIMFMCTRLSANILKSLPDNWAVGKSDNGWVTSESSYDWIKNTFHPWLINNNIELPILFYIDGFKSYLTLEFSEFCSAIGIIIISIPSDSSNFLQPIDYGIYQSLRLTWFNTVNQWKIRNNCSWLRREDFCQLFKDTVDGLDARELLSNSFKNIELLPFKRDTNIVVSVHPDIVNNFNEGCNFLSVIEENIGDDVVKSFEKVGVENEWEGEIEYESLFYFWQKIKSKGFVDNLTGNKAIDC